MSRRTVLAASAGLGVGGLAALTGLALAPGPASVRPGTAGTAGTALRIGYLPITDASPLLMAHAQGRFAAAGVPSARPVLFRAWESLAEAFLAGELDVVHLLMPFAVQLRYALGARIRVVGWNHTNGSALTVGPSVRDLGDLRGRSVAIPFWWSIHNLMLQRMLRGAGLRPVVREAPSASAGTVGLVVMSPADMLPALNTGTIAGYIVADPFDAAAELRKVGHIARFVGDVWRDHACCALVVRQELVDRAPSTVQAVTDAITGAQRWMSDNRAPTAAALCGGHFLPQPLPAVTKALTRGPTDKALVVANPVWQGERIGFAPYPFAGFTEAMVAEMGRAVVDGDRRFLDRLEPARVHGELVDDRFVRRSITTHGGPSAFALPASLTRVEEVHPT